MKYNLITVVIVTDISDHNDTNKHNNNLNLKFNLCVKFLFTPNV